MTETLFKVVPNSFGGLITYIGCIHLPANQQPYHWVNAKVSALFDSMYCGYGQGIKSCGMRTSDAS